MHELILGGCKSGKSRCAEQRAADWLALPGHSAVLLVTALPGDDEMRERIRRHRAERTVRMPALRTLEVPIEIADAVDRLGAEHRLLIVDCLTLWLTNLRMPLAGPPLAEADAASRQDALLRSLRRARGPVVLVSNEIGWGVSPLGRDARRFVDALGVLHQQLGAVCSRVTLTVAGAALSIKEPGR